MTRSVTMLVFSAIALGAVSLAGYASAQTPLKAQLVGSWTFVSGGSTDPSGRPFWGEDGKGLLIFVENGRYSSQLMRADLPKFGSGSRLRARPRRIRLSFRAVSQASGPTRSTKARRPSPSSGRPTPSPT